jgi:transposase
MSSISADTCNNIRSLLEQGNSIRKIADQCHVSKSTVQRIRAKYLPNLTTSPQPGRPMKLSAQNKHFCVRAITSGHLETGVAVRKKLRADLGIKVSDNTVRNALREAGLGAIEKETKPMLSSKNIKARLEFAKRHQNWTIDDWKRVIWSDETKINRFSSDGRSWCWIRDGETKQPHHVKQTVKHGGGSVMIWGCMTFYGPGFMCKINNTMDQHIYKDILQEYLLQTIDWYDLDAEQVIFQHDNDPKHKSRSIQEWLGEQEFDVIEWPPQSPDLSPIENLWATLIRRLNQYESPPKGMIELWERVESEWNKIEAEECRRLVESMPDRIRAVLKAKGRWTKY